jgi:hypothetical protein
MSATYAGPVPCGRCGIAVDADEAGVASCVCGARVRTFRFAPFRPPANAALPAALHEGGQETPCAYHARNAASEACRRCGSFMCSLCALHVHGHGYCPPCFERLRGSRGIGGLGTHYPRPHGQAVALGIVASVVQPLGLFIAPVVVWLGVRALRQRATLSEREPWVVTKAVLALVLSVLAVAPAVLLVVWLIVKGRPA